MFKNIIWDFDGTLFDTYPAMAWAFQKALAEQGISETEEEILKHIKISMGHGIDFYKDKYNIDVKEFVEKYSRYEDSVDEGMVYPFEHVREICGKVVDMSGRNFIITHRDGTISRFINYHGMAEFFTEIVIKEHGFKRKPDPEAFTYILEKYNIDNGTALAVGDRELDLLAAKNAGIRACLFDMGESDFGDKADYVINSMDELEDIIFEK